MISNQPVAPSLQAFSYFTYNPAQYDLDFNTDLNNLDGIPVVTDILSASITSPLDQETVVDTTTIPPRPIVPIFAKPIYAPFGLGYRRCAGEMFSYLVTEKIFDKFSTVEYEERPTIDNPLPLTYPLVSIAPFKRVSDNIFVKQQ